MRKIQYIIYVALATLLFTSCQEDDFSSGARGGIRISLTEDTDVDVSTRSTPEELGKPVASNFKFEINGTSYNYTDKVIPLSAGEYKIVAYYGNTASTIVLDAPYYEGTAEATVEEGKTTNVSLPCKVANALLSVKIKEDSKEKFNAAFPKAQFKLSLESGNNCELTDTTKSFYFPAGSIISGLAFSKDGSDYQDLGIKDWPKKIKAADHIIVTVGIEPAPSGVTLTVEKVDVQTVTIEETIPLEWLPKPKIGYFNDEEGLTSIEYTESNNAIPAKLNFSGSMAIEDIELGFEFGDKQYADWNSKTYNLASISEEDKNALKQAGIVLPELGKSTTGSIDFTNLTANLQVAEGSATENKIKVRVKANNRWSSEEGEPSVYTIKTIAPKITVSAKPEDIWAKSLTVSESEVESDNPTKITVTGYQYLDGAEWKDCIDGLAKLTDLPAEPKMQVRAVYREGVYAEPMEIALETPAQLPNSGMEDWYYENVAREIYTYYPWEENTESYWGTNNPFTTRYKSSTGLFTGSYTYNCFPAVSYVVGGHSGKRAVELRNTASGQGNTIYPWGDYNFSNVRTENKVAGELFTADFEVTSADGFEIKTEGRPFSTRPTALHFWYKYNPINTDTWRAKIVLMDADHNVIIENELTQSEEKAQWTEAVVSLDYEDEKVYAKCKYIFVLFSSTINTGDSMPYESLRSYVLWRDESQITHSDSRCAIGSVLTIDDIQLIYDK